MKISFSSTLLVVLVGFVTGCTSVSEHRRNLITGTARQQLEAVNYLASIEEEGQAGDEFVQLMKTVARGKATRSLARAGTFRAMGRHPHPEFIPVLIDGLTDASFVARYRAAEALGLIEDPRAVTPLIQSMSSDTHVWVQIRAIVALTLIAARRRTIPAMITTLDEDQPSSVRYNASLGLSALTGRAPNLSQESWKDWWENEGRQLYRAASPSPATPPRALGGAGGINTPSRVACPDPRGR